MAERPIYGYRRITALINQKLTEDGAAPINHKLVYRLMQVHKLLLTPLAAERDDPVHDGKVIVMRSNLRGCSDGFEYSCWNGDIIRDAFVIDAHDREILAWCVVVNAGVSGSDIRDIPLEAIEIRFGTCRAPEAI